MMVEVQLDLIGPRIKEVFGRVSDAAEATGRCFEAIRIIGVSKRKRRLKAKEGLYPKKRSFIWSETCKAIRPKRPPRSSIWYKA
jgi:hypothetical protein